MIAITADSASLAPESSEVPDLSLVSGIRARDSGSSQDKKMGRPIQILPLGSESPCSVGTEQLMATCGKAMSEYISTKPTTIESKPRLPPSIDLTSSDDYAVLGPLEMRPLQQRDREADDHLSPYYPTKKSCRKPLVSIMKQESQLTRLNKHPWQRPLTPRRVGGIWNNLSRDKSSPFEVFRNETVVHIFSYLPLADLSRISMVNKRWRSLSNDEALWKDIDATEFVAEAHAMYASSDLDTASTKTSEALVSILERRSPDRISIRDIGYRLCPNIFLPAVHLSLQELELDCFKELTDTHVHVMLLMSAQTAPRSKLQLKKLTLTNCPRLGNATVSSISVRCPKLNHLNLQGNPLVTDMTPVQSVASLIPDKASSSSLPSPALCSLQSLFFPAPKLI